MPDFELADKKHIGRRVVLHPGTDRWMRGDRYGEIKGLGNSREYVDTFTKEKYFTRPYLVLMDKSGQKIRVHPANLNFIEEDTNA